MPQQHTPFSRFIYNIINIINYQIPSVNHTPLKYIYSKLKLKIKNNPSLVHPPKPHLLSTRFTHPRYDFLLLYGAFHLLILQLLSLQPMVFGQYALVEAHEEK